MAEGSELVENLRRKLFTFLRNLFRRDGIHWMFHDIKLLLRYPTPLSHMRRLLKRAFKIRYKFFNALRSQIVRKVKRLPRSVQIQFTVGNLLQCVAFRTESSISKIGARHRQSLCGPCFQNRCWYRDKVNPQGETSQ